MDNEFTFTITDILASTTQVLETNGYQRIDINLSEYWDISNVRLFEDNYSVVAVVIYNTWEEIAGRWIEAQASFVELISKYFSSSDAKSWEGYLVLLTPGTVIQHTKNTPTDIRYDISRVRKLVGTGDDIKTLDDIEQILLPLLPLQIETIDDVSESLLEMLPKLLSSDGIDEKAVDIVVKAFIEQKPIVDSLHKYRIQNED